MTFRLPALLRQRWLSLPAAVAIFAFCMFWWRSPSLPAVEQSDATSNIGQKAYPNLHNGVDFVSAALFTAFNSALKDLNQHQWKDDQGTSLYDIRHRLHGVFHVPGHGAGQKGTLLVFASKGENQDCHVCAPWLSFMEFQPKGNDWVLVRQGLAKAKIGEWGVVPTMHVTPLTPSEYAVFLDFGFTAQGWTETGILALAWHGAEMVEVLSLQTGEADGQETMHSWGSRLNLLSGANGQLDLIVERIPGPDEGDKEFMLRSDGPKTDWLDAAGQPQLRQTFRWTGRSFKS